MAKLSFSLQELGVSDVIKEFLNQNIEEICPALSFSELDRNDRVEIGDVSVNEVRIVDDGSVEIEYEYEWSFFAGCKDIDKSGVDGETVRARLEGGVLAFDVIERPEPRTTVDEF